MRRGSISTFVDDGRRHSAGMIMPEYRSNSGNNNNNNSSSRNNSAISSRQEFSINDIGYERTGGCFVSYRKIAFAFVFFLALLIAAAFIGVHFGSPPDDGIRDALDILNKVEDLPDKYFLASSIKSQRYRIELAPALESDNRVRITGRVSVDFTQNGTDAPSQLVLNAKRLNIKGYRLMVRGTAGKTNDTESGTTSAPATFDTNEASGNESAPAKLRVADEAGFVTEFVITGNKTDEAGGDYVIFLERALEAGNYTLDIEYETLVGHRVIVAKNITKDNEDNLLLVSKLKPVNAPWLFPMLDETRLKTGFTLTLLHPRETKVLSNMPSMNSSDSDAENTTADTFMETPLISAHNLAFVSGRIENLGEIVVDERRNQSIAYWADVQHKSQEFYLYDKLKPVVTAYSEMFGGVARPTDKLALAALPVDFDGISAPGLIVVRESLFYAAVGSIPLLRAKSLLTLIGLVGQQWLGGLVDARNWTDAWYIEGSVLYLQHMLFDKIEQSLEGSGEFLVDVQMEAMENDGYKISKALSDKVDHHRIEAFDLEENYKKGACLISMLHAVLGEAAFRTGYADFLRRWSYSTADSDSFLHTLASNATIDDNVTRLDEAFRSWTRQSGYPVINVTWIRENGTVVLRQEMFNFDATPDEDDDENPKRSDSWWVPITYVKMNESWSKAVVTWLKGTEETTLENVGEGGNSSWIVFNVNRTGFYRVNYDERSWKALAVALRDNHNDFPVLQRAAFIDDALSLARQGSISYGTALELLDYLGPSERSYAPWRAFARHAEYLDFALYETAAYSSFQEFTRKLVSRLFDETMPKINEGSPLAVLAIQLACLFEHEKCTNWTRTKWEDVFRNNAENTLMKHLREMVYCAGAQRGGREELTYFTKKFDDASDRDEKNRLLSALGCFQTPWILQKILNEVVETNKYDDDDVKIILRSYAKNPAAAQAARRFIQDNWEKIVNRYSNSYWTMKAFVEASTSLLFTEHDLNEFNAFRDKHIDSLKTMGHWVALNEVKASSWIFRLKESYGDIQKWFAAHASQTSV